MTRAILIRHAETEWNRAQRWQGQVDIPLSAEGELQATDLAARLWNERRDLRAVYTSDLSRAVGTAAAICRAFDLDPIHDPAWREMDVGCWSGLLRTEIAERFATDWVRITEGEDLPRGGGETFATFTTRVVAALQEVHRRHAGATVAVVTHGGVIRALLLHHLGLPYSRLRDVARIDNTALAELCWVEGRWQVVAESVEEVR